MNCRLAKLIVRTYEGWDKWFSNQNKKLRAVQESVPWLQGQIAGDFDQAVSDMWQKLSSPKVQRVGNTDKLN